MLVSHPSLIHLLRPNESGFVNTVAGGGVYIYRFIHSRYVLMIPSIRMIIDYLYPFCMYVRVTGFSAC